MPRRELPYSPRSSLDIVYDVNLHRTVSSGSQLDIQPAMSSVTPLDDVQLEAMDDTASEVTHIEDEDDIHIQDFSARHKKWIVAIASICGLVSPLSTNIYFPALIEMKHDLDTTEVLVNATISIYIFMMGIAPMAWASFADVHGRRYVYILSLLLFAVASAFCGLSRNVTTLIVMRLFQAAGASSVIAVGAGTIGDIYPPAVRGTAMGWFFQGPLIGPLIGPIIGGFMTEHTKTGWRSIFDLLACLGAVLALLVFIALPETHLPTRRRIALQARDSAGGSTHISQESVMHRISRTFSGFNPLRPMTLLRHPAVIITTLYMAIMFSALFIVTTTIPRTFLLVYRGLTTSQIGLLYLAGGAGNIVGSLLGGRATDLLWRRLVQRETRRLSQMATANGDEVQRPVVAPENRLGTALIGAIIVPIAYIAYGWVMQVEIWGQRFSIIAPLSTLFMVGFGNMFIMTACNTFLVDAFPTQSASAVSLNNLARSFLGAVATLVAVPMQDAMGTGWLMTAIALMNVAMSFSLILALRRGRKWHAKRQSVQVSR